jgi:hypothetical protein
MFTVFQVNVFVLPFRPSQNLAVRLSAPAMNFPTYPCIEAVVLLILQENPGDSDFVDQSFGLSFHLKKNKSFSTNELPVYLRITVDGIYSEVSTKGSVIRIIAMYLPVDYSKKHSMITLPNGCNCSELTVVTKD